MKYLVRRIHNYLELENSSGIDLLVILTLFLFFDSRPNVKLSKRRQLLCKVTLTVMTPTPC